MIVFTCPACGQSITVKDGPADDEAVCAKCGETVAIPSPDDDSPEETHPEFPALDAPEAPEDFPPNH